MSNSTRWCRWWWHTLSLSCTHSEILHGIEFRYCYARSQHKTLWLRNIDFMCIFFSIYLYFFLFYFLFFVSAFSTILTTFLFFDLFFSTIYILFTFFSTIYNNFFFDCAFFDCKFYNIYSLWLWLWSACRIWICSSKHSSRKLPQRLHPLPRIITGS